MTTNSYEIEVQDYDQQRDTYIKKMALKRAFDSFKKDYKARNAKELEIHYLMLISYFENGKPYGNKKKTLDNDVMK